MLLHPTRSMQRVLPALSASFLVASPLRSFASAPDSVIDVQTDAQFESLLAEMKEKQQVGVLDFTAKWCGPCRTIAPHFSKLSIEHPNIKFMKLDIETPGLSKTVQGHGITAMPTFIIYKGATRVGQIVGANLDQLKKLVQIHSSS
uniref:Thioredoxin domain-containing protein n=1 Tax=Dunaliella tertiolecta TaxID=3047 RepID=A0A7S3RAM9_DUNTE|mmetsp:Transcript_8314/g.22186  ORF Transcript_8314/g.22186 Transcript_8314/m.22186 type:complete len:146 (+) Transcript_8314:100-537(+)